LSDNGIVARRICVVGASGSGKSRLAARLARQLSVPHIELDGLHHRADWQPAPLEEFRQAVSDLLAESELAEGGWVVDGNYRSMIGDLVAGADLTVWLDYPRGLVLWRVMRRSLGRVLTRRELWNGNQESWRALLSRDPQTNIVLWSWRQHRRTRAEFGPLLAAAPQRWVRLRSPHEMEAWLETQESIEA
jgi:adenylate kinase family enzyme